MVISHNVLNLEGNDTQSQLFLSHLLLGRWKSTALLHLSFASLVKETPFSIKGEDHECIFTPERYHSVTYNTRSLKKSSQDTLHELIHTSVRHFSPAICPVILPWGEQNQSLLERAAAEKSTESCVRAAILPATACAALLWVVLLGCSLSGFLQNISREILVQWEPFACQTLLRRISKLYYFNASSIVFPYHLKFVAGPSVQQDACRGVGQQKGRENVPYGHWWRENWRET